MMNCYLIILVFVHTYAMNFCSLVIPNLKIILYLKIQIVQTSLNMLFFNFLYLNNQIKEMVVGIATNQTNQRKKNQQQTEKNT